MFFENIRISRKLMLILLLISTVISCASPMPKSNGVARYPDFNEKIIAFRPVVNSTNIEYDNSVDYHNIKNGLLRRWRDIIFINTDSTKTPDFYLVVNLADYSITKSISKTVSPNGKIVNYYDVYETSTVLTYEFSINNFTTNGKAWSEIREIEDINTNRVLRSTSNCGFLDITCEIVEGTADAIIDGAIEVIDSAVGVANPPPENKPNSVADNTKNQYKSHTNIKDMLYLVGIDIGKSMPGPFCKSDSLFVCFIHFITK